MARIFFRTRVSDSRIRGSLDTSIDATRLSIALRDLRTTRNNKKHAPHHPQCARIAHAPHVSMRSARVSAPNRIRGTPRGTSHIRCHINELGAMWWIACRLVCRPSAAYIAGCVGAPVAARAPDSDRPADADAARGRTESERQQSGRGRLSAANGGGTQIRTGDDGFANRCLSHLAMPPGGSERG